MSHAKRIAKEHSDFARDPPAGFALDAANDESNLREWRITLAGPSGSPYEGFLHRLTVDLPSDYPFKPPVLSFTSPMTHPNVNAAHDGKASICLGQLRPEEWKPSCTVRSVLDAARDVLVAPAVDDPVNNELAQLCRESGDLYWQEVRTFLAKNAAEVVQT